VLMSKYYWSSDMNNYRILLFEVFLKS
jgi:hypothetical protein